MSEPRTPRRRRRRPPERTDRLARLSAWLSVHRSPRPEEVGPLALRLGVTADELRTLALNMRQSPAQALSLTASALLLAERPRPAPRAVTVATRPSGDLSLALLAAGLPPAAHAYAVRMAAATKGTR